MRLAAMAAVFCTGLAAQFTAPQVPAVLLVGSFRTNLSYEAALEKLDGYYQEQLGRKLPAVLPLIAPQTHYEAWHDIWVFFAPEGGWLNVTLKRQTEGFAVVTAKGWMIQIAGRVGGELPLRFEERPALRSVGSEIAGSRTDVARALKTETGIRLVETWQYAGLLVSSAPLVRVELARSGPLGVHRLTVTAETEAGARQLSAKVAAAMRGPCICAVYSETAEIDQALRKDAVDKADDPNANTAQKIYLTHMNPEQIEEKLRAEPEMQKRIAAAAGWVGIRYRVDKSYGRVQIRWSELAGYSRSDGKFESERPVGASSAATVKAAGPAGAQLTARTKLSAPLKPGAYRIAIEGVSAAGETVAIERRDYWFDGKTFEEL